MVPKYVWNVFCFVVAFFLFFIKSFMKLLPHLNMVYGVPQIQNLQRALSQKERGYLKPCQYQNLPCWCSCCCHHLHLGKWHLCLCDLKVRQPELVLGQVDYSLEQAWECSLPCVFRLTQWRSHCSCVRELCSTVAALLGADTLLHEDR